MNSVIFLDFDPENDIHMAIPRECFECVNK